LAGGMGLDELARFGMEEKPRGIPAAENKKLSPALTRKSRSVAAGVSPASALAA